MLVSLLVAGALFWSASSQAQSLVEPPYELRFQFNHDGKPSPHTYLLKWASADSNLQSIEVFLSATQERLQTILVPQDGMQLIYQDLKGQDKQINTKLLDVTDFNFDQYADLRLMKRWPYKVGEKHYQVFLFDKVKNQYVFSAELSALPNLSVDPRGKFVQSTSLGALGGSEYVAKRYTVGDDGKILLQARLDQTIKYMSRLTFIRDIRERQESGVLQRVCKLVVPAEGKPQRVWGTRKACDKYLDKPYP